MEINVNIYNKHDDIEEVNDFKDGLKRLGFRLKDMMKLYDNLISRLNGLEQITFYLLKASIGTYKKVLIIGLYTVDMKEYSKNVYMMITGYNLDSDMITLLDGDGVYDIREKDVRLKDIIEYINRLNYVSMNMMQNVSPNLMICLTSTRYEFAYKYSITDFDYYQWDIETDRLTTIEFVDKEMFIVDK